MDPTFPIPRSLSCTSIPPLILLTLHLCGSVQGRVPHYSQESWLRHSSMDAGWDTSRGITKPHAEPVYLPGPPPRERQNTDDHHAEEAQFTGFTGTNSNFQSREEMVESQFSGMNSHSNFRSQEELQSYQLNINTGLTLDNIETATSVDNLSAEDTSEDSSEYDHDAPPRQLSQLEDIVQVTPYSQLMGEPLFIHSIQYNSPLQCQPCVQTHPTWGPFTNMV